MTRTIFLATALSCLALSVSAQENCYPREQLAQYLSDEWGEAPVFIGLSGAQTAVELWYSQSTQSWSIVRTSADGESCMMTSGMFGDMLDVPPPGVEG